MDPSRLSRRCAIPRQLCRTAKRGGGGHYISNAAHYISNGAHYISTFHISAGTFDFSAGTFDFGAGTFDFSAGILARAERGCARALAR
jgi:hypothetical protein